MECHFCGCDPNPVVLAPNSSGPQLEVFSCIPCATAQGLYCEKHEVPHTGFLQGGSACLRCIEEAVRARATGAEEIWQQILEDLPTGEHDRLHDWAELAGEIVGDSSEAITVLRAVMTEAYRRGIPPETVVQEVRTSRSVDQLIPESHF